MTGVTFTQLVDLEKVRQLLEAHFRITGMVSAILDTDENILVAVGWQEICTRFHRAHPVASLRCRESDAYIKAHIHDSMDAYLEYRCRNGLWDVAMPICIGGEYLATIFTGQFFYDDDKPDPEFFRAQAGEFGFDEAEYLSAMGRVQVCTHEHIRNIMDFYRGLVQMMAEMGLNNLKLLREAFRERKTANPRLAIKAFAEDKEAVVTITDNAGGIPDNTIGNVFDLYFTTREASGGTGIGLYMAKSIIEKHMEGRLGVANVEDGTQFRIEVNRSEKAPGA